MTSCREVKGREIVKEDIKRVNIGRSTPKKISNRGSNPREREFPVSPGC